MGRLPNPRGLFVFLPLVLLVARWRRCVAHAAATAQGVALNASAGCSNGNLDITLTTVGANREAWRATNLAGATLAQGEGPAGLPNFSGTFVGLPDRVLAVAAGRTRWSPPTPMSARRRRRGQHGRVLRLYNCTTREVLLSCYGPYGTCPQTAQQALALLAPKIPTLGSVALLLTALLVAARADSRFPSPQDLSRRAPLSASDGAARPGVARRGSPRPRQVSSRAMTTAISLWLVIRRRRRAVRRLGRGVAVAAGANPWWYVAGAPLVYLGDPRRDHVAAGSRSRGSSVRRARRKCGSASRRACASSWDEMRAIARSGPQHGALSLADCAIPRPRRARAPVLLLHGVLCNAGVDARICVGRSSRAASVPSTR